MATTKSAPGAEQERGAPQDPGNKVPIEAPPDHFGTPHDTDAERWPEGSPAREGQTSPPSGQGGAMPHDGVSHQDSVAPNPPPSDSAREKGEENDRVARGEVTHPELANEKLAAGTGTPAEK